MGLWKKVDSETVFEHPRLTVMVDTVLMQNGEQTDYLRYKSLRDWPTPIVINAKGQFLLIREHAYPVNEVLLQFPEGDAKEGESLEETVNRELHEEAGLKAHKITLIGHSLRDHRRSETRNYVMVLENLEELAEANGDPEEIGIEKVWLSEAEVWTAIANGKIIQKNTLSAWTIYQASKR